MRKAYSRRLKSYVLGTNYRVEEDPVISFEPTNLEGVTTPHEDALVIRATITNYDIARVFMDLGGSINILFKEAFNQMQIDPFELRPLSTSLFGFASHEMCPLG